MKRRIILCAAMFMAAMANTFACTNLIVGKNASADGSTIVSYSADSYGLFGELYHYPAATYPKGTMLKVYEWDTGKYLGEIVSFKNIFCGAFPANFETRYGYKFFNPEIV